MTRRAILFDRDGTLNAEVGHVTSLDQLRVLPSAPPALALARAHGFATAVITNQSGIARGLLLEDLVREANRRVAEACGGFDAIYYCPHHPSAGTSDLVRICSCRKPAPGMIERAARELDFKAEDAFFIGDSLSDVGAARNAGVRMIVVLTGKGQETMAALSGDRPEHVARNVLAAVRWIVRATGVGERRR